MGGFSVAFKMDLLSMGLVTSKYPIKEIRLNVDISDDQRTQSIQYDISYHHKGKSPNRII